MLTPTQFQRKYRCPCIDEGVKCQESFRYLFNLKAHIMKEHKFTEEGKKLIAHKNLLVKRAYDKTKAKKKVENDR